MKLRTSFFDPTVFKKNVTRFAPAWGLYTICLLMGMLMMTNSGLGYWFVANLAECIQIMMVINMLYALLNAQLLFGDLYNSRMCNALHAMPLRREGWFVTNAVSGLAFSLVPTFVATMLALALAAGSDVIDGWQVALYWFLGTNLGYLFFFGLAVLCAFLVGNRFAMVVVYAILNAASFLVYTLVDTLYTPLLYGVKTWYAPFMWLCPIGMLVDNQYVDVNRHDWDAPMGYADFTVGQWWYLWICAAIGIALLAAALLLYRKRKLESAGDFIAVKVLEPVFLVVFTLAVGVVFYYAEQIFSGGVDVMGFLFLGMGLVIGFFVGRMLLLRTVRVFRKKAFAGCAAILAVIAATMGITALDPFGIESWMPEPEEVEKITVNYGNYVATDYNMGGGEVFTVEEDGDIANILRVHGLAIEERYDSNFDYFTVEDGEQITHYPFAYTLTYTLADGRTVSRYYSTYANKEAGVILRDYFSSTECVLGKSETELVELVGTVSEFYLDNADLTELVTDEQLVGLMQAIAADCAAGNMAQRHFYHKENGDCGGYYCDINLQARFDPMIVYESNHVIVREALYLTVYGCCENTIRWIQENDLEQYLSYYQEKYGQ